MDARPADRYLPCDDLWVIAAYYNPAGYRSRIENYQRFARPIREAGIPLVTVECASGDAPFALPPAPDVIQVRSQDALWQKERLINLAVASLPAGARKIAWLDCDLLFTDPAWAVATAALLDDCPVAQPFDRMARLPRGESAYRGDGRLRRSFACQLQQRPESALLGTAGHGYPGVAWAARRELLARHGLYDAAIVGAGDELFAHALGGGFGGSCARRITGADPGGRPRLVKLVVSRLERVAWPRRLAEWGVARTVGGAPAAPSGAPFYAHYVRWAIPVYRDVRGRAGCAPGLVLHLWHGEPADRGHAARHAILKRHRYDPQADLRLNSQGAWEWAGDKPGLRREVAGYFFQRREDG